MQEGADTYKWNYVWTDLLMEACPIPMNDLNWNLWERSAFLAPFLHIFCAYKTPSFLACSFKALDKARLISPIYRRQKWDMLSFPKMFPRSNWAVITPFPVSFAKLSNQASSAQVDVLAVVFLSTQKVNKNSIIYNYYYHYHHHRHLHFLMHGKIQNPGRCSLRIYISKFLW